MNRFAADRAAAERLDQLVAIRSDAMPRSDFVQSVVPLSEKEASTVLENARLLEQERAKQRMEQELPADVPTVYKPFSVATLREAVRKLLAG